MGLGVVVDPRKGGKAKEEKPKHVVDRWSSSVARLLFFQAGLFPKNRAEPFFIHISTHSCPVHRRHRTTASVAESILNGATPHHVTTPSRYVRSPRSGLHLCTPVTVFSSFFFLLFLPPLFFNLLATHSRTISSIDDIKLFFFRLHLIFKMSFIRLK